MPASAAGVTGARSLLTAAVLRLRDAGSPTPRLDAELLVAHAFGRDRAWLHAHPEEQLDAEAADRLRSWITRREAGEPVAYIRGFKEWYSLRIATDPRALIPRPETELLAEAAIEEIARRLVRDGEPIAVWEVATGSGAVATALGTRFRTALALERLKLAASDASAEALELAAENLAAHGLDRLVALGCGDLLEPAVLPGDGAADVLIANLPYLATDEVDAGAGSLRHEPRAALDGGVDGLALIRRLLDGLPRRMKPDGVALLEVGAGQADAVQDRAEHGPMQVQVSTIPDLAGIQRVVRIARTEREAR